MYSSRKSFKGETMKKGFLMLIMLFFLSACSEGRDFDAENEAAATKEGGSGAEVIAERLDVPWTIAHTGGIFFITERK